MNQRYAAVLTSLMMLLLASCDRGPGKAAPTPSVAPPAPVVAPPPPPATTAPAAQATMAKPPGADPAKLAEHAKALEELGYRDEAAKLYGHACDWGYAPACAHIKAPGAQMVAKQASPAPAKPAASNIPAKPAVASKAEPVKQAAAPAVAPPPVAPSPAAPPATPAPAHVAAQPAPAAPVAVPAAPPAAPIVLAAAKPMLPPPTHEKPSAGDIQKLTQQAHGLEDMGYVPVAVTLYKDACLGGDGPSCKRLGEIYITGSEGVQRDYAESVRWYGHARRLGVNVPSLEKRTLYR